MPTRSQRTVYLITYSRANLDRFQSRESFASAVLDTWNTVTSTQIERYVVCKEKHNIASETGHEFHYHMAIKLREKCRWLSVRNALDSRFNMKVHFSDKHTDYVDAYDYVVKEDNDFIMSPGHPRREDMRRATQAIASRKAAARKNGTNMKNKKKRKRMLSVYQVTQIIRENKISTRMQLLAMAASQERTGNTDLAEFIANRGSRVVNEALDLAQELQDAEEKQKRLSKSRIDILEEELKKECVKGCENKKWLKSALQILQRNDIDVTTYCRAIFRALDKGRGKYTNIYIFGPANTAKTFMLTPLKIIYKAFVNPATGGFAWVGAETAEVIMLNDFRWHPTMIAWSDFLQMLEGDIMHLAAPKSFMQQDIVFDKDTPFFATADAPLVLIKGKTVDHVNTNMMKVRWCHFEFNRPIPEGEQEEIVPCGRCFAELVLSHKTE